MCQPLGWHYFVKMTGYLPFTVLSFHMRLFFCLFLSLFLQLISDLSRLIRIVGNQSIHAQFTEFFMYFSLFTVHTCTFNCFVRQSSRKFGYCKL